MSEWNLPGALFQDSNIVNHTGSKPVCGSQFALRYWAAFVIYQCTAKWVRKSLTMARVHYFVALFALMVCAACSGTPTPELIVPTVAELPTLADTELPETPTILPPLTHTLPPAVTFASSNTPTPAETTQAALLPSGTDTQTETATVTPSLTITPT